MKYRTKQQFKDICENVMFGNWRDAASLAVESGFYANDLLRMLEEEELSIISLSDLVILVEIMTEKRYCKEEL